jgi:hypothetical protein
LTKRPLFTFGPQPSLGEDFDPLLGRSVSDEALSGDLAGGLEFDQPQAQPDQQDPYEDWFSIPVTTPVDAAGGNASAVTPPAWTQFKVKSTEQVAAPAGHEPAQEAAAPTTEVAAGEQVEQAASVEPLETGAEEPDAAHLQEPAIIEETPTQKSPPPPQDWDVPLLPKLRGLDPGVWDDAPILGRKAAQASAPDNAGLFGLGTGPAGSWDEPSPKPAAADPWDVVAGNAKAEPPVVAKDQISEAPEPSGVIPASEPEPASAEPPVLPAGEGNSTVAPVTEGDLQPADLADSATPVAPEHEEAETTSNAIAGSLAADDDSQISREPPEARTVPDAVVVAFDRLRAATADLNTTAGTDAQQEAPSIVQDDPADVQEADAPEHLAKKEPAALPEATADEDVIAPASDTELASEAVANDRPPDQTSDANETPARPAPAGADGQPAPAARNKARQRPTLDLPSRRGKGTARPAQARRSRRPQTGKAKRPVRRTPAWVLFGGFVTFAVSLMLIAASMAAPLSNAFHTISVFLWYWAGMAVASAAIWAVGRRWVMTIASLVLTAFALYFLVPASGVGSVKAPTAHTIGWVNLQGSQDALTEVLKDAEAEKVDLMILAELPQGFAAPPPGWSMIEQPMPGDPQALAVLSKGNWRAVTVKDEPTMARPLDNAVTVIAVNASGGADGSRSNPGRQSEINRAAARAGDQDTAAIAVGDFGEPAWTQQMRQFAEYSGGQRLRCGGWLGATFSRFGGLFGWSADHAFIINGTATKCKIGGGLPGTNHRPLWIGVPAAPAGTSPAPL